MERKRNGWDFMCEHPFITMMIVSSICEVIKYIRKPKDVNISFGPGEEIKSCGSTEEEPEATKEEN